MNTVFNSKRIAELISLIFVFLVFFFIFHNNVYSYDDIINIFCTENNIYHFPETYSDKGVAFKYGTWIMWLQNIVMYVVPYKLKILLQTWSMYVGAGIKSACLTGIYFVFLKTFRKSKIPFGISCLVSLMVFFLMFCSFVKTDFFDFLSFTGFFRFVIPAFLMIVCFYLLYNNFSGEKINPVFFSVLLFFSSYSSEIAAVVLFVVAFELLVYQFFNNRNDIKEYILFALAILAGGIKLALTSGFQWHLTSKLSSNFFIFDTVSENISEFLSSVFKYMFIDYFLFWFIFIAFLIFNIRKKEGKNVIFTLFQITGILVFAFSLCILGKTHYSGGFWIVHQDIHTIFIILFTFVLCVLIVPFFKYFSEKVLFKTAFKIGFALSLVLFLIISSMVYEKLFIIKDYTYIRDKMRMFYAFKNQAPILPETTQVWNICLNLKPVKDGKYVFVDDLQFDEGIYVNLDSFYYPFSYNYSFQNRGADYKFIKHDEALKIFEQNGGKYDEVLKRTYNFKNLRNKDFVLR